jgi:hypothetical protein
MWRFAGQALGKVAPFLKTQTPRLGQAAKWLQSPLNRAYVGGGLGVLSNNEGTLGGRLRGGLMGAGLASLGMPGQGLATRGLVKAGLPLATAGPLANVALPAAGIALAGNQRQGTVGGEVSRAAGGAGQAVTGAGELATSGGAGWVAHNTVTGETIPLGPQGVQDALAPGMGQYGPTGPMGTILNQLDPRGPYAGRRLGTKLDSKTNAEALNILMPTILKWSEETKRRDLARDMQAAGIRQNIATNAALNQIAAQASADRGTTASSQLGGAITNKYSFG